MSQEDLRGALDEIRKLQLIGGEPETDLGRIREHTQRVSRYYDLVTRFYEFAWGSHFHFAPRRPNESERASQKRLEEAISSLLKLRKGMKVADVGCGIGGPLVTIAKASGASITGINYNAAQLHRCERGLRQAELNDTCDLLYADFMDVPLEDATFDAIYSIEAACHAPNRQLFWHEMSRLLKPGGEIAIQEWGITHKFDRDDEHHQGIRERIEKNNAVTLTTLDELAEFAQGAGFEVVQNFDQHTEYGNPASPWYMALQGREFSFASWARSPMGRKVTAIVTRTLESIRIIPEGIAETSRFLNIAADSIVAGGEIGIFSPLLLIHARKRM